MIRKIMIAGFMLAGYAGHGQQDAIYSQYMFNLFELNPACAGSHRNIYANTSFRNQWAGTENNPVFFGASIHSPFSYRRMGSGLNIQFQNTGIFQVLNASAAYAYKINFANGTLSSGISAGIQQFSLNTGTLLIKDPDDPFITGTGMSVLLPDLGSGLYYQDKKMFIGLSAQHLLGLKLRYDNKMQYQYGQVAHWYFFGGYKMTLNTETALIPSLLIRYIDGLGLQYDATLHLKYKETVWLGTSYRNISVASFQAGMLLNGFLPTLRQEVKIAYAYDYYYGTMYPGSTCHEIMICFDLEIFEKPEKIRKRKPPVSPLLF